MSQPIRLTLTAFAALLMCHVANAGMQAGASIPIQVLRDDASGVTLSSRTVEPELIRTQQFDDSYDVLNVSPEAWAGEPGGPAVPSYTRWVVVPEGMQPRLNFDAGTPTKLSGVKLAPFPAQGDNPDLTYTPVNPDKYNADIWTPPSLAAIEAVVDVAGARMALLRVSPYQFNPARGELVYYPELKVEVDFVASAGTDAEIRPPGLTGVERYDSPAHQELRSALTGGEPRRDLLGQRMDNLGHYVIIVGEQTDDIMESLQPLIEWKERMGYLVTVVELPSDNQRGLDSLRAYLKMGWREWPVPPTHVLVIGDAHSNRDVYMRHWDAGVHQYYTRWHISDHPLVLWRPDGWDNSNNPQDWIPDGFVGRLPVQTISQLDKMVSKILHYEMTPYTDDDWVQGAVLIAAGVQSCRHTNIAVKEIMVGQGYSPNRIYRAESNWPGAPDHNIVNNNVDNGVGFVSFRGYDNWGGYYNGSNYEITNRRNGWKMPVVTGMVCSTNDFLNTWKTPNCIGESWLLGGNDDGMNGAIACFGPTDITTTTWFNNTLTSEFYHTLFDKGVHTLGALTVAAKMSLMRNYPSVLSLGSGYTVGYYFYTYNILGDPGIQVWTREPQPISLDFAENVTRGANLLEFGVDDSRDNPVEGAYVHVYNGEVRYGGYTDADGTLELLTDPLEEGEYLVTVTGPNLVPVLETFDVETASVFASLEQFSIDDDGEGDSEGNGDGAVNPGETVEITVTLLNSGTQRSGAISGVLSSESEWVEITGAEADWEAIASGESGVNQEPFLVRINPATPDGAELDLRLVCHFGDESSEAAILLTVDGLEFGLNEITFEGGIPIPGTERELDIALENTGGMRAGEMLGTLMCSNPHVQIRRPESRFPAVAPEQVRDNSDNPFLIFVGAEAYYGTEVEFTLSLEDANGLVAWNSFKVTLGDPDERTPQGPDAYGYYAFDRADSATGLSWDYNFIEGNQRINGLDDWDDRANDNGNHGSVARMNLPFPFTYYGREYEEITIGSNGWLCFGRTELVAWNNQEMGSSFAPPAMLAPYWDDLWSGTVWTRYDRDGAMFVVEWRQFTSAVGGTQTFEVVLLDPTVHPSATGDGDIIFQYASARGARRDNYAEEPVTVGITSPDRSSSIEITHAGGRDPRSVRIGDRTAIRFSTGAFNNFGSIEGRVTLAADDSPVQGARVMLDGTGLFGNTAADGSYHIAFVPEGNYTLTAYKRYHNYAHSAEVEVVQNEVTDLDFLLIHPLYDSDIEAINITVKPDSSAETAFTISNGGDGLLEFHTRIEYERPERDHPWDVLLNINATEVTGDYRHTGVAFDGENLLISGTLDFNDEPHKLYTLNRQGELLLTVDQMDTLAPSSRGWDEFCLVGESILAVEYVDRIYYLLELDLEGNTIQTVVSPLRSPKCITYSPERNSIFVAAISGNELYELDRNFNVVHTYPNIEHRLYTHGLAWYPADPDGYNLYLLAISWQDDNGNRSEEGCYLWKMNVETGDFEFVRDVQVNPADQPEGMDITKLWDPLIWSVIILNGNPDGDNLIVMEMGPNLTWMDPEPDEGVIEPDHSQDMVVSFSAEDMPEGIYEVVLQVIHNAEGDRQDIPVQFNVSSVIDAVSDDASQPLVFALEAVYPNPFNPVATFSFALPEAATAALSVFDLSGRLVDKLTPGRLEAGRHQVAWDGARLSSGVYMVRLDAGGRNAMRKMALIK